MRIMIGAILVVVAFIAVFLVMTTIQANSNAELDACVSRQKEIGFFTNESIIRDYCAER